MAKSSDKDKGALVEVYTALGQLEAQIVKARLESEGIPVLLKYESVGVVYGLTVDGLGQVRLLVPRPCAEEARAILASNPPSQPDQPPELKHEGPKGQ